MADWVSIAILVSETIHDKVKDLHRPLDDNVETLTNELDNNRDTIRDSQIHVNKLRQEARILEGMLDDTRTKSNKSISAATAYQKIIDALDDASTEAEQAEKNAQNATAMVQITSNPPVSS